MRRCVVPGCRKDRGQSYIPIFLFPKNEERKRQWEENMGCVGIIYTSSNVGVCIKHFSEECLIRSEMCSNKADGTRKKKVRLAHNAQPTICSVEEDIESTPRVNNKGLKRQQKGKDSSAATTKIMPNSSHKTDSNETELLRHLLEKQKLCTTNRPIITVIKIEDVEKEEPLMETVDIDIAEEDEPIINSNVTVEHKEITDVPVVSEAFRSRLEGISALQKTQVTPNKKRSMSVCSNSSSESNETPKSPGMIKRRKLEKPPPMVTGLQNDCYCWVCHKEGVVYSCIACPRAFHQKCAGQMEMSNEWVCPECCRITFAENVDTRSETLSAITLDKFCTLLKCCLNKLKARAPAAFHQPVPVEYYSSYLDYVIHPMDLSLIEKNISQKTYGCTESFLADVKWIQHNSCVFNGAQHPLTVSSRSILKTCEYDMAEIEICPDCFLHASNRSKYWFSDLCSKPHPVVWAKLKGFPYWPAKVVRILRDNVDARFFGAHDRAWVPISQCYHLSKEMPTTSKPKKKGNYETALEELEIHVQLLTQRYGKFEYAPYRTSFDVNNKYFLQHGIDLDKIETKEVKSTEHKEAKDFVIASSESKNSSNPPVVIHPTAFAPSKVKSKMEPASPRQSSNLSSISCSSGLSIPEKKKVPSGVFEISESFNLNFTKSNAETAPVEKKISNVQPDLDIKKIESAMERLKNYFSNDLDSNNLDEKDGENSAENHQTVADSSVIPIKKESPNELKADIKTESPASPEQGSSNDVKIKTGESPTLEDYVASPTENGDSVHSINVRLNDSSVFFPLKTNSKTKQTTPSEDDSPVIFPLNNISEKKEINTDKRLLEKKVSLPPVPVTKKLDLFARKLEETIESCKAKLGIAEFLEDSDDDSCEDEEEDDSDDDGSDSTESLEMNTVNYSSSESEKASDSDEEDISKSKESNVLSPADGHNIKSDSINSTIDKKEENVQDPIQTEPKELDGTIGSDIEKKDSSVGDVKEIEEAVRRNLIELEKLKADENVLIKEEDKEHMSSIKTEDISQEVPEVCSKDQKDKEDLVSLNKYAVIMANKETLHISNEVPKLHEQKGTLLADNITLRNQMLNECIAASKGSSTKVEDKEKKVSPTKASNVIDIINLDSDPDEQESTEQPETISDKNADSDKEAEPQTDIIDISSDSSNDDCSTVNSLSTEKQNSDKYIENNKSEGTAEKKSSADFPVISSIFSSICPVESNSAKTSFSASSLLTQLSSKVISGETNNFDRLKNSAPATSLNDASIDDDSAMDICDTDGDSMLKKTELISSTKPLETIKGNILSLFQVTATEGNKPESEKNTSEQTTSKEKFSEISCQKSNEGVFTMNETLCSENADAIRPSTLTKFLQSIKIEDEKRDNAIDKESLVAPSSSQQFANVKTELHSNEENVSNVGTGSGLKHNDLQSLREEIKLLSLRLKQQEWLHTQEKNELRHNMNLIIMEMRASLELDKKEAIELLKQQHTVEEDKTIMKTKMKQWCANCLEEAVFHCCWNTSYCNHSCQKQHWPKHRYHCTQIKFSKNSKTSKENTHSDQVILVNVKSSDLIQPTVVPVTSTPSALQADPTKVQFISSNSQIQLVHSSPVSTTPTFNTLPLPFTSNSPVQFVLSTVPPSIDKTTIGTVPSMFQSTSEIITKVRSKQTNLTTAISLINKLNKETEETLKKTNKEISAEDIQVDIPKSDGDVSSGSESANGETTDEEDFVDEFTFNNNAESSSSGNLVDLGYGVKICEDKLEKCADIGGTATKLTRCLMRVLFPDNNVLAESSVYGRKSNKTKLTRPALHMETIQAILDFVIQKFPAALKSDLVMAMNLRCSEVRRHIGRQKNKRKHKTPDNHNKKKQRAEEEKDLKMDKIEEKSSQDDTLTKTTSNETLPANKMKSKITFNSPNSVTDLPLVLPQLSRAATGTLRTVVSTQLSPHVLPSVKENPNAISAKDTIINTPYLMHSPTKQIPIKPNAPVVVTDKSPNNELQITTDLLQVSKMITSPKSSGEPLVSSPVKSPTKPDVLHDVPVEITTKNIMPLKPLEEGSSKDENISPLVIETVPVSISSPSSPLPEQTSTQASEGTL